MFVLLAQLLLVTTACSTKPPDIQPVPVTKLVYPTSPKAGDLTCPPEPKPGVITTDVEAAKFAENLRVRGENCAQKLEAVRLWVQSWPAN